MVSYPSWNGHFNDVAAFNSLIHLEEMKFIFSIKLDIVGLVGLFSLVSY